jgi:cytochrome c biogenesis protein CcdA
MIELSLALAYKLISLAIVDALNPCALAVMILVLTSVLMQNPEDRKKVLYAGLAFTFAVYLGYFIYGMIFVNLFKYAADSIPNTSMFLFYSSRVFGALAIILGLLNVKDYVFYRPGGVATEMPLSFRPRVNLMIKKITSPLGAFFIGLFVTIFLIPCAIGPYLIFSSTITNATIFEMIGLLLVYNLIFIIPMLIITFIIYLGFASVERVSGWKEKNIKKLHLFAGIILIILGILMVTGVI